MREDIYEGILSNDIVAFHTRSYRRNFLLCCRELFDLEVDEEAGRRALRRPRRVGARLPAADLGRDLPAQPPSGPRVHEYEREILRRRREHLILRVDRADLSKNVLRGFTAFDLFLEQHPEFKEQVTFIAHLIPSRQDVPEYAEYLERIEALVAVVNHRHGTTDWMPIELRLRENLEEAIAAYKHYDLLMVNAMFDGMNLIAKEGPLVNERNGVSLLSREHRRARGAGRVRAVGQPVRRPGAGRRDPPRAHHVRRGALLARPGPQADRHRARSRRLGRRPARGHRARSARARAGLAELLRRGQCRIRRAATPHHGPRASARSCRSGCRARRHAPASPRPGRLPGPRPLHRERLDPGAWMRAPRPDAARSRRQER